MALTKCKECKKEVSTSAKTCPHCGVKDPGTTAGQMFIGLLVVVGLVWGGVKIFGGSDDNSTTKTDTPKTCSASDGQ
ncbi:TPA: hydrogenase maturation nickel metallochaperone HypA, partial [Kluyvera intermedia]|nr:hydrogenase maturation nickel metallochaperone HypA [Kluyvera intermedia]HAT2518493.1 hydrogenase maturation nickel metallochaperone HypA [Kluyvera intermedia]HAT2606785.1 hydrogenase maturation nickel metallochaperone HypA [Kluyvera intermedia]HAT2683515.1 hydrogenase maturation nickel metallochaperone HypA [Kluyvera intermedia]HAT2700042.1 hydrogenase maturation nickel metallochaperone HypA [Kluyvera intermedia]